MEEMQVSNEMNPMKAAPQSIEDDFFSDLAELDSLPFAPSTGSGVGARSQILELEELPDSEAILEQISSPSDFLPSIPGGDSVRGSQLSHQTLNDINIPGASNDLVPLANNGRRTGTQLLSAECLNPSLQSENAHVHGFRPARRVVGDDNEAPVMPNMPASGANKAKQAGSEPSYHQNKDINVQSEFNDNQTPSAGSGMIQFTLSHIVVEMPDDMHVNLQKVLLEGAIRELIEVAFGRNFDNFRNTKLPVSGKVTISKERGMQIVLDDFKECDSPKHKKRKGATENDNSYDTKKDTVEEPHDSKGITCPGIRNSHNAPSDEMPPVEEPQNSKRIMCPRVQNSDNALSDEIPPARNQNAGGVIPQSASIKALSPKVEEQSVDSMHQTSDPPRRKRCSFSPEEVKLLVNAADRHGIGGWANIKRQVFKDSDKTPIQLRDKWNSLLKTAGTEPAKRKGEHVPEELLRKVQEIEDRDAQRRGKPLNRRRLPPNNPISTQSGGGGSNKSESDDQIPHIHHE